MSRKPQSGRFKGAFETWVSQLRIFLSNPNILMNDNGVDFSYLFSIPTFQIKPKFFHFIEDGCHHIHFRIDKDTKNSSQLFAVTGIRTRQNKFPSLFVPFPKNEHKKSFLLFLSSLHSPKRSLMSIINHKISNCITCEVNQGPLPQIFGH